MEELTQHIGVIIFWISLVALFVFLSWRYGRVTGEYDRRSGIDRRNMLAFSSNNRGNPAQYERRDSRSDRRQSEHNRRGTDR